MKTCTIDKPILEKMYVLERKTTKQIAEELKVNSKSIVSYWLKKHQIKTRKTGGGKNFKNITNKEFGLLTAKYRVPKEAKHSCAFWFCECKCGKTKIVASISLRKNLTTSCGCERIRKNFRGHGDLSGSYWNRIIKGAKKRKLKITITLKDAWNKFLEQNKTCALTGMPLKIVRNYTRDRNQNTASLDRINSNKGYSKDNIQWVHRDVNIMKNKYDLNYFINLCEKIYEYTRPTD